MRSECGVLNTHFLTGSTMGLPPPSEMNGMPVSSTMAITAMVSPVVLPPSRMSTLSFSSRRFVKVTACLASPPVS